MANEELNKRVYVRQLKEFFNLEQLSGDDSSLDRWIIAPDVNRPGLQFAGFFDYFDPVLQKEPFAGELHKNYVLTKTILDKIEDQILESKIESEQGAASDGTNASLKSFLKQKEREYIEQILGATGGDNVKAAEALKVNLSTLYRKLSDD